MHGGDIYTEGILKGKEIIDFSSNINPLGISKKFEDNIQEAVKNVIIYPDIKYREVIGYLKKYTEIYDDYFILGNGAAEIIDIVISCFKSILLVVPSFIEYENSALKYNLNIKYSYIMNNKQMDVDYEDILCRISEGVECIIIGNPNNPNGKIIDKSKFMHILIECQNRGITVIIDEAFIEFAETAESSFIKNIHEFSCLFIIRALTKFFGMPGIRFGYGMTSNTTLIDKITSKQIPWNINCFAECAVKYSIFDKDYIEKTKILIKKERKYLLDNLQKYKFIDTVYPSNANFLLIKLKYMSSESVHAICMEKGILIRMCIDYKGIDERFIRIAVKNRKSNEMLLRAFKYIDEKICNYLR